mgnify:CR=1 FL=1
MSKALDKGELLGECRFQTARSGGKGGQHVNKTETKVQVFFNPEKSNLFTEQELILIKTKLKNLMDDEGTIYLSCEESRSQLKNKELVLKKLLVAIKQALLVPKKRKASKPSKSQKEKRLKQKKVHAQKKELRRKPPL